MIFARKMKEIADVANEKKDKRLRESLRNVCSDIIAETEKKIESAAADGWYGTSTCDLYDRLKTLGIGRLLVDEYGYSSSDIASRLACMVAEKFIECGFNVEKGKPTDNDCYCVYITWDKEPQKCAIGKER